jgi:transcriptional regulator with AAA-type ATPase domain
MVFDSITDGENKADPDRFFLKLYLRPERFRREVLEFLEAQLRFQVQLAPPRLARMRPTYNHPPSDWIEGIWDLRIRLTDFVRRFLVRFRREDLIDPFTVFFLSPSRIGKGSQQARSGHFGYEFELDDGQLEELEKESQIENEKARQPPRLTFPNGVCATVFLEARASLAHDLASVKDSYEDQPELERVKRFEEIVLGQKGLLIEIPAYAPGIGRGASDGPELIVTLRVNPRTEAGPNSQLNPWEGWRSPPKKEDSPVLAKLALLKSADSMILLDGEAQVLTEICQRLISIYLRATTTESTDAIIFRSREMRRAQERYRRIARSDTHVLILGASGTGKSEAASEIAKYSHRDIKKFRRISAATISPETTMSQLFGHVAGAYSDALKLHDGLLSKLNGGTLFLDDLDALDTLSQARLLSYLDTKKFFRFGGEGDDELESDVRLICATNMELTKLVSPGADGTPPRLRRDFLYRVAEQIVRLPRLKDRKEDIPLLIDFFKETQYRRAGRNSAPRIDPSFQTAAMAYEWPNGDLRELRQAVLEAMILTEHPVLKDHDLENALEAIREHWISPKEALDEPREKT